MKEAIRFYNNYLQNKRSIPSLQIFIIAQTHADAV